MNSQQLFNIAGQVAVVTAAARGLGRAYAEVLASNGAHVVLTDIDAAELDTTVAALRAAGGSVEGRVLDAGHREAVQATIEAVVQQHGRLDIAFANAGISAGPGFAFTPNGLLANIQPDTWDRVLAVNLSGVMATLQAAVIGRAETLVGYAYSATKAAVINLVRHAAIELAPHAVTVNAIAPGPFVTNIAGGRMRDPAVRERFARMLPMQRVAEPEEIKGLALLLASPASSFITGTVIPIDGGATAGA